MTASSGSGWDAAAGRKRRTSQSSTSRQFGQSDGRSFCRSLVADPGVASIPTEVFYDDKAAGRSLYPLRILQAGRGARRGRPTARLRAGQPGRVRPAATSSMNRARFTLAIGHAASIIDCMQPILHGAVDVAAIPGDGSYARLSAPPPSSTATPVESYHESKTSRDGRFAGLDRPAVGGPRRRRQLSSGEGAHAPARN